MRVLNGINATCLTRAIKSQHHHHYNHTKMCTKFPECNLDNIGRRCINCFISVPAVLNWDWCVAYKVLIIDNDNVDNVCNTFCFLYCCYNNAYSTWWTSVVNDKKNILPMADNCWYNGRFHCFARACCNCCYICSMLQADDEHDNMKSGDRTNALRSLKGDGNDPCRGIMTCHPHTCFRYTSCCIVHSLVEDKYEFPRMDTPCKQFCFLWYCCCWCPSIEQALEDESMDSLKSQYTTLDIWCCPCCVTSNILITHIDNKLINETEKKAKNTTTPAKSGAEYERLLNHHTRSPGLLKI